MGKVFAILLIVVGIWTGVEVATKGTAGAFDGALVNLGLVDAETATAQPASQRAGAKVAGSHAEADARRDRLLEED